MNKYLRFALVLLVIACLLSIIARITLLADAGWPVGIAVWLTAFLFAYTDLYFRNKANPKG